jgi:hypothetical protein
MYEQNRAGATKQTMKKIRSYQGHRQQNPLKACGSGQQTLINTLFPSSLLLTLSAQQLAVVPVRMLISMVVGQPLPAQSPCELREVFSVLTGSWRCLLLLRLESLAATLQIN